VVVFLAAVTDAGLVVLLPPYLLASLGSPNLLTLLTFTIAIFADATPLDCELIPVEVLGLADARPVLLDE